MPNCDYYAELDDHRKLLDWLFGEKTCRVYEAYSRPDHPLREFTSTQQVLAEFDHDYGNGRRENLVFLQLLVRDASPSMVAEGYALIPEKCHGATHRFKANGLGMVQLQLRISREGSLWDTHTNHNSLKRAQAWAEPEEVALWDFSKITAFSSRMNRVIRKEAVAKLGSHAVLPGALAAWKEGISLHSYPPMHPLGPR